jgi:hypothetical protein
MANVHFPIEDLPNHKAAVRTGSWLQLFGRLVAKMAKLVDEATETRHAARRQRYAALLG